MIITGVVRMIMEKVNGGAFRAFAHSGASRTFTVDEFEQLAAQVNVAVARLVFSPIGLVTT